MKLSEAIRLGSMIRPQGFYSLMQGGKSCALGAAIEATLEAGESKSSTVYKIWPWVYTSQYCPVCIMYLSSTQAITHLNDIHRWTRERIADWVETIEPKEVVKEEKKEVLEEVCV